MDWMPRNVPRNGRPKGVGSSDMKTGIMKYFQEEGEPLPHPAPQCHITFVFGHANHGGGRVLRKR